jgi:hypothetical protein
MGIVLLTLLLGFGLSIYASSGVYFTRIAFAQDGLIVTAVQLVAVTGPSYAQVAITDTLPSSTISISVGNLAPADTITFTLRITIENTASLPLRISRTIQADPAFPDSTTRIIYTDTLFEALGRSALLPPGKLVTFFAIITVSAPEDLAQGQTFAKLIINYVGSHPPKP